jgi:hypothetical protein
VEALKSGGYDLIFCSMWRGGGSAAGRCWNILWGHLPARTCAGGGGSGCGAVDLEPYPLWQ